jgi:uncharacterized protein (TIGR02444 family)
MSTTQPLWDYSIELYDQPTLRDLLLQAQDEAKVDINFILLALFASHHEVELTSAFLDHAYAKTHDLRVVGINPIRTLRTAWKSKPSLASQRTALLQLELSLERQLQDTLFDLFEPRLLQSQNDVVHLLPAQTLALTKGNLARLHTASKALWDEMLLKICQQVLGAMAK